MTETKPHEHCWTTSCNDEAAHMTPTRVAKLYNTDKIDGPEAKAEPDSFDFKLFSFVGIHKKTALMSEHLCRRSTVNPDNAIKSKLGTYTP